LDIESVILFCD